MTVFDLRRDCSAMSHRPVLLVVMATAVFVLTAFNVMESMDATWITLEVKDSEQPFIPGTLPFPSMKATNTTQGGLAGKKLIDQIPEI